MTMLDRHLKNPCEACLFPQPAEDSVVAHLLDRISELEDQISNLRRLEETIQSNNSLFDALLSKSHDSILLVTPEMTVLRLVHSVLGYPERDLRGQPLLAFVHPDDGGAVRSAFFELLLRREQTRQLDIRVRDAQGAWLQMEAQLSDMLDHPHVQAIVLNCRPAAQRRLD